MMNHHTKPSPYAVAGVRQSDIKAIEAGDIIQAVCKHMAVTEDDIFSKTSKRRIARARQVAMWFIRKNTTLTLDQISEIFYHKKDHSTVLYSIHTVDDQILIDRDYKKTIADIQTALMPEKEGE